MTINAKNDKQREEKYTSKSLKEDKYIFKWSFHCYRHRDYLTIPNSRH